jgi:hypothetical protein
MPVLSTLGAAIANVYGFTSGLIKDQYCNTTQGTFSPFSQTGWGNYFNGSSSILETSTSIFGTWSTANASTTTATIEAMVYVNALQSAPANAYLNPSIIAKGNTYLNFSVNSTGNIVLFHYDGSFRYITSSGTIQANTWNYVAVTITGGTATIYINGTSSGSGTWYGIQTGGLVAPTYIGQTPAGQYWNGYISNLRVSSTVRTIATPLVPYTNDGNTSLLTCQSNRFRDASTNGYTITASGSPSITPFSPFAPTQSYSASAVGGSGYFDGSGDYLSVADNAAFTMGTGDFTVEYWVYWNGTSSTFRAYGQVDSGGSLASISIRGGTDASNKVINGAFSGTTDYLCTSTASLVANTWNHIAFVRDGTTLRQYINGGQDGTASISTASVNDSSSQFAIGRAGEFNGNYFGGYISSFRLLKGTCLYPSGTAFTPPTAPLTNITNTSLLLNFTNAGVVDATAKNVLETVGNAQISTTQSKWGGGSISFDGTSNTGLKAPAGNLFTFGSGAFTVEFWVRFNSVAADQAVLNVTGTTNVLTFYVLSTGSLNYYLSSNGSSYDIASGVSVGSISTGQWYRVALVRSGNTFTPYLNTTAGTTSTSSSALATPSSGTFLHLGMSVAGTSNFNGYIDDVRVTRGVARDMTVLPTAPFPVQ